MTETPKNGEALVAALEKLAERVESTLSDVRSCTEIYADDIGLWGIEKAWNAVNNARDELPDDDTPEAWELG